MLTPQTPVLQSTTLPAASEVQASDNHHQEDYQQLVKEIFLRHLIDGSVKENERQNIVTGVSLVDLASHRTLVNHNQDTEQFAASINKLPVGLLLLEDLRSGTLSPGQTLTWTADDRRDGFGEFDQPGSPLSAPLEDVLYDMLHSSGNTAVRILVNKGLGGASPVNHRLAANPELSQTTLQPLHASRFFLGNSTPRDSLWTIDQLMKRQDRYARFMKDAMADNIFEEFGVRSQLADDDYILLVNKVGILDDTEGNNRHDVGILY
ncbi:MAG: serine hydrolase, partial [Patescibacteria group bacterium]